MDAKTRPLGSDTSRPIDPEGETRKRRLRADWRPEDPSFLLALNAVRMPRAALCALAIHLPRWRRDRSTTAIVERLSEHEVRPGHARIALELYHSARQSRLVAVEACSNGPEVRVTTCADRDYPQPLFDLPLPPPVLFHRGAIPERPGLAIVGSRRADRYGLDVARRFAQALAARGLTIVSGFARGIDQAAHRGAIGAPGGTTIAVLGCGLDVDYPTGSTELAREIPSAGSIVSEFPLDAGPQRHHFPVRNRIIAALSLGTLVVQGTERSGSLITARLALDLGRDVYAVPGRVSDPLSSGTNRLIQDGAFPALTPDDILEALPVSAQQALVPPTGAFEPLTRGAQDRPPPPRHLEPILSHIGGEATPLETLAAVSHTPVEQLLGHLLELEIGGWIERLHGSAVRLRRSVDDT